MHGTIYHHDCRWFGYFSKIQTVLICVQSVIISLIISTNIMSNNLIITSLRWKDISTMPNALFSFRASPHSIFANIGSLATGERTMYLDGQSKLNQWITVNYLIEREAFRHSRRKYLMLEIGEDVDIFTASLQRWCILGSLPWKQHTGFIDYLFCTLIWVVWILNPLLSEGRCGHIF